MTGNIRYVIFSVTEKVIWSQEEDMPVAFTEEQQAEIRKKLYDAAKNMVIDTPYHAIKVEELTKAAGISKGAFYKFYPAKELLFYEILRSLHEELFSSAMENFTASQDQTAEETLCRTLLDCYDSVHTSRYRRFWMKDSHEIWKFLNQFGPLAVSEELAFASLRALIMTVYSREKLGPDYATILRWMAQGVCSHIF